MSVRRKLFIMMIAFIVGMGIIFAVVTQFLMRDVLQVMVEASRKDEIGEISQSLAQYYQTNGDAWTGIEAYWTAHPPKILGVKEASVILLASDSRVLLTSGDTPSKKVQTFGIRSNLMLGERRIATLIYHDAGAEVISQLRIGVLSSTRFLLMIGTFVFVLVSLFLIYWLARRLTAPLRALIPVLDRLGKGEYGIQAPVTSQDEYGKVAEAFNVMSAQLDQAESLRRNMAADVAHELRTPLTIISGKLELLQQEAKPLAPEVLLPLQDELIRLTRLVDDLHQLSLAEAKKLPLERKPVDMLSLLGRIVEHFAPDAQRKDVKLSLHCAAENTVLWVDAHRITQVFYNLLTNAIRYTTEGGRVEVWIEKHDDQHLRLSVRDTGMGIDGAHLPFLFERFYRMDEARARNSGGMGLGLAIAKQLILAHKGTIEVSSQLGEGSVFTVTLPFHERVAPE
ncbi:sensor histidine kinase [Paenibacillus qinlingensis]|uniref:sensor histidine kinase n=1 Tax=Paenibacillus qinlingensis TaxID=1837343 RepID=UPI001563407C|nr:ATP-binding protein [Paenibacillus qinlingensis]NQX63889.1 HAMP domain-containing protein [Paenibacillus qinlingensis]